MGTDKDQKGLTDAKEINDLILRLSEIDLDAIKLEQQTPQEKLVEALRNNEEVNRYVKSRGRPKAAPRNKGKLHWKVRAKKRREYYVNTAKPWRSKKKAEQLSTPEGWWEYLVLNWKRIKVSVGITREEWFEHVWPCVNGRLFVVKRYDTSGPISLGNIYLEDVDTRKVLYDGKEYLMRQMGYML